MVATTSAPTVTLSAMPSAIPTTAPPTLAPSPVACTGSVLLLTDEALVGSRDASNLLAALVTLNHPVTEVSSFATGDIANGLLSGHSTLIIPAQVVSLLGQLSVGDASQLVAFTAGGGTLVVLGAGDINSSHDVQLLNGLFGISLDHDGSGGQSCRRSTTGDRSGGAVGTPFGSASGFLFWKGQTHCLDTTSLPAGSSTIYGDSSVSWVARLLDGSVVYIGYNWRTTASNTGWNNVLSRAIDSSDLSACASSQSGSRRRASNGLSSTSNNASESNMALAVSITYVSIFVDCFWGV